MKIIISSVLENISTRNDGTVKLTLGTQELDPGAAGNIFQLRGKFIKVFLSDDGITDMEANVISAAPLNNEKARKSPSNRLRNVLFVLHSQGGGDENKFDEFYKSEMERIIDNYKAQLQ